MEAGCDEAGRGCLAGPVFAAAVILPPDFQNDLLNDSKQLTEKQRYALRPIIEEQAVAWAVGIVSAKEIDKINILNASFLAMHRAVDQLKVRPEHLIIDGNRFKPYEGIKHQCVVKGDGKYMSIAAASILAKTYRDDYMNKIAADYPAYQWTKNKGYPTKAHREAIEQFGHAFDGTDCREVIEGFVTSLSGKDTPREVLDYAMSVMPETPQYVASSTMQNLVDRKWWPNNQLTLPVMVICTQNSGLEADNEQKMQALYSNLDYTELTTCGHFIHMEQAKMFNEKLFVFVKQSGEELALISMRENER